jgi:hypothetical protein
MTKEKELCLELEQTEENLERANLLNITHEERIYSLEEEKAWHNEQYCLMRDERDALERQIELEHELIEVKISLNKAKTKRKEIDFKYINEIEPKRRKCVE